MSYFVPITTALRDAFLGDDATAKYLRVVIDPDGTPVYYLPTKVSCDASKDYQKWNFTIKNRDGLSVGLHANLAATVDVSHNGTDWVTVFTGFVSDDGFSRSRGMVTDDYLSLDLVDATKRKGTKRKPSPALLASFKASDPSATSASVLHYLANQMGASVEASLIDYTIDLIELGQATVWNELQALKEAYHADMYFRYDGKLLFCSPLEDSYTAPSSEWTFQGDPAEAVSGNACRIRGKVNESFIPVECNKAKTEFDDYEVLTERIVYKNTEGYSEISDLITITLAAGAYWPGPEASDVARLEYQDPESGEQYPFAIDIATPDIGAVASGADIEYTGGTLTLVSFNGSTSATTVEGGAAQIILQNTGASTCTIRKLTIQGTPYRIKEQVKVEHADISVSDEVDYVEQEVNGRYAASASQIFDTLYYMVEEGKGRPRRFGFNAPFMPWIQRRAVVNVQMPGEAAVSCRIDTYSHRNSGHTLQGMYTQIICTETGTYTPTGSPYVETTPALPAWQAKLVSIAPFASATYRSASTSAPASPKMGDWWYQTDMMVTKRYSGEAWEDVGTSPFGVSEDTGVAFETPSGKVQILNDGTIKAVDGNFKGALTVESDDSTYVANIDKTNGIKQTKNGVTTFHAKPDGDIMLGNYDSGTNKGGIYYDKSEDKLYGNVAYDEWDLVIQSDSDLALLTTGTTTYANVLIAPGTYNFTATVDLNAHGVKRFVGCGIGQSILNVNYTPSSGNVIYAGSTLGEIGNFRLTTNKTQTGTASTIMWIMIYGGTYTSVINVHDIKIDSMNGKGRGVVTPSAGSMYYHSFHNVFVSDCYYGFMYCGKLVSCMAYNCYIGFHYCEFISLSYAVSCTTGWANNTDIDYNSTNCDQQWTLGSQAINHGVTYTLPKGSYIFYRMNPVTSAVIQVYDGSTWYDTSTVTALGTVVSDGTNMRIINNSEDTNTTVYWRKKP